MTLWPLMALSQALLRSPRFPLDPHQAEPAAVVMVTSEEALLRGPDELRAFLRRYVQGPTTYSWTWDRRGVSAAGTVGWLLAEGTESAAQSNREEKHPYRMSMICEKRDGRWLLLQVHGSSPHHG